LVAEEKRPNTTPLNTNKTSTEALSTSRKDTSDAIRILCECSIFTDTAMKPKETYFVHVRKIALHAHKGHGVRVDKSTTPRPTGDGV
jgi:hypothetical protein